MKGTFLSDKWTRPLQEYGDNSGNEYFKEVQKSIQNCMEDPVSEADS